MAKQRKKYSSQEKAAYYVGYGRALDCYAGDKNSSYHNKAIDKIDDYVLTNNIKVKRSHSNGWDAAVNDLKKK